VIEERDRLAKELADTKYYAKIQTQQYDSAKGRSDYEEARADAELITRKTIEKERDFALQEVERLKELVGALTIGFNSVEELVEYLKKQVDWKRRAEAAEEELEKWRKHGSGFCSAHQTPDPECQTCINPVKISPEWFDIAKAAEERAGEAERLLTELLADGEFVEYAKDIYCTPYCKSCGADRLRGADSIAHKADCSWVMARAHLESVKEVK
jgi:hypothetical protein